VQVTKTPRAAPSRHSQSQTRAAGDGLTVGCVGRWGPGTADSRLGDVGVVSTQGRDSGDDIADARNINEVSLRLSLDLSRRKTF